MSMQKNKGSGWERDVAKFLTEIFGYTFIRNIAGSGAFVGGKNSFRKNILTEEQLQFCMGDIAVPTEMKKMCIECKFYKEFPFHHFLINESGVVSGKQINADPYKCKSCKENSSKNKDWHKLIFQPTV
mgnify:CR=1 FL=1